MHLVDRLEARCLAAMAAGAEVDPDEERQRFDAALFDGESADGRDPAETELRRALGLR